ncbi:unnamed protein product [Rotaria sp. Silwood1]|nr:unnamed protein product [Rotaria sp. Silwood1]CAF3907970.1 unnamed protein product [Rotaria sp. Silwood1]CAF4015221.1 unnamed protein product [Rotaria sp. Silwood1]CAF4668563.1 unnamed protein product [Rotaria sp. Silwood1]CAF4970334.1 unnamed protein product [Rotaria sp. Silwood1]
MNNENVSSPVVLSANYSGGCGNESFTNGDLLKLTDQQACIIYGPTLFALKYRVLPCTVTQSSSGSQSIYDDIYTYNLAGQFSAYSRGQLWSGKRKQGGMYHGTSCLHFLINEYKADPDTFIYDWTYDTSDKNSVMSKTYVDLGNYLSVQFSGGCISPTSVDNPNNLEADHENKAFNCFASSQVFHVPQTTERARILLQQLSKFKLFPVTEATLQMVCHDTQRGFYTSSIRMKKPHITDLKIHYGDDFPDIHTELLEVLQEKDSTGITFLHGPPGTGKTFYLRYLINEIKDKNLIYVPPDLVNDMTKPGFLPFLMRYPNSILIVEDAENIIRDRNQETFLANQAVANLLNLSDGLLGDAMHQQIICTFNCDVRSIDSALLRDGRLVVEHKFDKLSVENARRLCSELGIPGNGEDIHESISLAEIYARKNESVEVLSNNLENGQTSSKNKRTSKKNKKQTSNSFFGFYS